MYQPCRHKSERVMRLGLLDFMASHSSVFHLWTDRAARPPRRRRLWQGISFREGLLVMLNKLHRRQTASSARGQRTCSAKLITLHYARTDDRSVVDCAGCTCSNYHSIMNDYCGALARRCTTTTSIRSPIPIPRLEAQRTSVDVIVLVN